MTTTTHSPFGEQTEAIEVARAFASQIRNKRILVTGVNVKGIGFATAEAFASQHPASLIVAGRDVAKLEASIAALKDKYPSIDYRPLKLNLASQRDVRSAARELLSWEDVPTIDMVVNSAGIMNLPERTLSEDGIEMHFATNHIGHFLFTNLIVPKLTKAAEASGKKGATRIINVTSLSPTMPNASIRWSDINFDAVNKTLPAADQPAYDIHRRWGTQDPENKSYLPLEGYNQSKVANVLFSVAANKRLYEKYGILSLAVHPGIISTELGRNAPPEVSAAVEGMLKQKLFTFRSLGAGAATSLVAATDPLLTLPADKGGHENLGVYLIDCQISDKPQPLAVSSKEAERLWALSEDLVKEQFDW